MAHTLAEDRLVFPVGNAPGGVAAASPIPEWQRWNDFGIGLLRKGELGELRQAKQAFEQVEALGMADGPLNLARVFIKEGLVQTDAPQALARAAAAGANEWSLLWFGAEVAESNGDYDTAIANMREIIRGGFTQAAGRGFNFANDYRVLDALGNALYQRGLQNMGEARVAYMKEAADYFNRALVLDPENLSAHYGLGQVYRDLGEAEKAAWHGEQHERYKPDDNARDLAVAAARRKYPAANRAAEAVVIYDLQREGAYQKSVQEREEMAP